MIVIVYNSSKGRFENIFSSEPQDVIIIDLDLESHEPIHVNDDFSECLVDTPYDLLKQYYRLMTGEQPSIYRLAQWHKQLGNKIDCA